jgi:hypothetical protein
MLQAFNQGSASTFQLWVSSLEDRASADPDPLHSEKARGPRYVREPPIDPGVELWPRGCRTDRAGGKFHRSSRWEVSRHLPPTPNRIDSHDPDHANRLRSSCREQGAPHERPTPARRTDTAFPKIAGWGAVHRRRSLVELENNGGLPNGRLEHLLPRLLGPIGTDRGLRVPLFLRRGQNRREAEGLEPQLSGPAHRVVQVLVLLLLDLLVSLL